MAQVPPPPPPAAAAAPFALTPGQANATNILDYSTSDGQKLYKSATSSLYQSEDDLFDCNAAGLKDFMDLLHDHAMAYVWDTSVLDILTTECANASDLLNAEF